METLKSRVGTPGPTKAAESSSVQVFEAACYPQYGLPYPLLYSLDKEGKPKEGGQVRFSWDASGLYVFAELEDSYIIVKNQQDEQLHSEHGDVFECFVKPSGQSYYWEMYATPSGNKSTLFFPSNRQGLCLNDMLHGHEFRGLEVSVEHTAIGWNAFMFIPMEQLTALGAGWVEGAAWMIFCGRYNYNSEDLADPELSMAPALSRENYHLIDEYAFLKLSRSNHMLPEKVESVGTRTNRIGDEGGTGFGTEHPGRVLQ